MNRLLKPAHIFACRALYSQQLSNKALAAVMPSKFNERLQRKRSMVFLKNSQMGVHNQSCCPFCQAW